MAGEQDLLLPWTLQQVESQATGVPLAAPPSPGFQRIGAVSRHSGVPVKTIRFYCDQGLLQTLIAVKGATASLMRRCMASWP
ncbi:MAG: MerR family DNA-binding transcriptional regulator [Prochlorococcaceae cyanobacterium]